MFQGYLDRKTQQSVLGRKLWERRYFKLKTHALSIFVDENGTYPESTWKISSIKTVRVVPNKGNGTRFELLCTKTPNKSEKSTNSSDTLLMELRANNASNCEEWVSHISEEKKKHRTTLRYGLQNIAMEKQKELMKSTSNESETKLNDVNKNNSNRNRKSQFRRQSSKRFKLNTRTNSQLMNRSRQSMKMGAESPGSGVGNTSLESWAIAMKEDIDEINSRRTTSILSGNIYQTTFDLDTIRKERMLAEEQSVSTADYNNINNNKHSRNDNESESSHNKNKISHKPKLYAPVRCEGYLIRRFNDDSIDLSPSSKNSKQTKMNNGDTNGDNIYYFELCDDTLEYRKHKLKSNLNNNIKMNGILGSVSVDYIKSVSILESNKKEFLIVFDNNDPMFDDNNRWYLEVPSNYDMNNGGSFGTSMAATDSANNQNLELIASNWVKMLEKAKKEAIAVHHTIINEFKLTRRKSVETDNAARDSDDGTQGSNTNKDTNGDSKNDTNIDQATKPKHQIQKSHEYQTIAALADCIQDSTIAPELEFEREREKDNNLSSFNLNISNVENDEMTVQISKHINSRNSMEFIDPNRNQQRNNGIFGMLCCCCQK